MSGLLYQNTLTLGSDLYDLNLSDLEVLSGASGPILAAVTRSGGLVTYAVSGITPTLADTTSLGTVPSAGQRARLVDMGDDTLLLVGADGDRVQAISLDPQANILSTQTQTMIAGAAQATNAALSAGDMLVLTGPNQASATAYTVSPTTELQTPRGLSDTPSTFAKSIGALAAGAGATAGVVLVGSQTEFGVTAYELDASGFSASSSIGPADGLGLMAPTSMTVVTIGGQSFALVASTPGTVGGAGALSVLRVGVDGSLTPTDHILDTRDSRFGNVQTVAAIEIDGRGFVVAGGADQGLSLFTLTPDGQLIHLHSLAASAAVGLTGISDIELVANGSQLEVFVIREGEAGIAHFAVDLSDLGNTVQALASGQTLVGDSGDTLMLGGAGRDNLSGGAGDDILVDGAEDDRLTGNSGADLFVLMPDGTRDTITDFDPALDRIDLTAWAFLFDVSQLRIEQKGGAHTHHLSRRALRCTKRGWPID